jgi:hypothetical protein
MFGGHLKGDVRPPLEAIARRLQASVVSSVSRGSISRRDPIEGNVGRYIVSCHDVLHTTNVPVDVVPIIFPRVLQPVCVGPVELTLIAFPESSLPSAIARGRVVAF